MEYTVTQTKQIAVTANSPEEAQQKVLNGEGTTISSNLGASPRPQQGQPSQPIGRVVSSPFQQTQTAPTPALNG